MHLLPAALDPDRDEARRLLQAELDSGDYQLRESLLVRLWNWFTGLLPDGYVGGLPPWAPWVLLTLVLAAAAAIIGYAARDRWRTGRLSATGTTGAVLEGQRRTAQEYHSAAEAALRSGDAATAALEAYRAITARAIERTLLDDRPGRTAREVAVALGPVFPDDAADLWRGADLFDAVRYGEHPATTHQAAGLLELDDRLRDRRPRLESAPSLTGPRLVAP